MKRQATMVAALWISLVMKCFLPALLIYFLVLKPLIGTGYGIAYSLCYVFVVCPLLAAWLKPRILKKLAEKPQI